MKFICQHCGATLDTDMPRCPYCDALIPAGAEAEYMDRLYAIREDTEQLKHVPRNAVRAELRHQGRRIRRILLFFAVIAALLACTFALLNSRYDRDHTADYIWMQEHFPTMSALYEAGDYAALEAQFFAAMEEDHPLWEWEYYEAYCAILEDAE